MITWMAGDDLGGPGDDLYSPGGDLDGPGDDYICLHGLLFNHPIYRHIPQNGVFGKVSKK